MQVSGSAVRFTVPLQRTVCPHAGMQATQQRVLARALLWPQGWKRRRCHPAVRASLFLQGEDEGEPGEGEEDSWADTVCSVAWYPLLPSLRRWLGTDGRTPLQIHKRKHQPVTRTPARGREGPFTSF